MKSQLFPVLGILTLLVLFSCEKGKKTPTDPEVGKTVSSVTYTSATSDYKNELSFEYDTQGRIVRKTMQTSYLTITTDVEYGDREIVESTYHTDTEGYDHLSETVYKMDGNGRAVSGEIISYDETGDADVVGNVDFAYDEDGRLYSMTTENDFGTVDVIITWKDGNITDMTSSVMGETMSETSWTYGEIPNDSSIDLTSLITSFVPTDQTNYFLFGLVGECNANLAETETTDGITYTYSYYLDDSGRVVKAEIHRDGSLEATYEIRYAE